MNKKADHIAAAIEKQIDYWERQLEQGEQIELAPLVEDQLHSLRGRDPEMAAQYDWVLAV